MTGWAASLGVGRVQAAEQDVLYLPRGGIGGKRGVVLCHGAGGSAQTFTHASTEPAQMQLAHRLAAAGLAVVAGDFGGDTFGNDTVVARIDAARTLLAAQGCKNDKVILVGISMGGLNILNYTRANPSKVAALIGIVPLSDIVDGRTRNPSLAASMESAWGIGSGAAFPARANPTDNANAAAIVSSGARIRLYYSSADTVIGPATVTTLAGKLGVSATLISSTQDHSDASVGLVPAGDMMAVIDASTQ